jgi:O-antigen/teichoic acid export membrane protein
MCYVYQLAFTPETYLLLTSLIFLPFVYAFDVYKLYKINAQNSVLVISTIGIAIVFAACLLLIPVWQINGALLAQLLAQLFLVFLLKYRTAKINA